MGLKNQKMNQNDVEDTTIKLKRSTTKKRLNSLKNYLDAKSFDEVISGLISLLNEYKLKDDLKKKYFTTCK